MTNQINPARANPTAASIKLAFLQPTALIKVAKGISPNIAPTELINCATPASNANCCAGNQREINTKTPINEKADPMPIKKRPKAAVTKLSVEAKKKEPAAQSRIAKVINLRGP